MGKISGNTVNLLAAMAAVLTISITAFDWWSTLTNPADPMEPTTAVQSNPSSGSKTPIATPTLEPSIAQMYSSAKSVKDSYERDRALRIVAETAVTMGNYDIAINAGASSPTSEGRADTLTFVARSATEAGLYDLADKAASEITIITVHDSIKIEILAERNKVISGKVHSIGVPGSSLSDTTHKK
ncbi:MAG: hypothetical protein OXR67_06940 [Chloroflexota bacterium]|nr:hypothetical protein [Chloroflexota bacterium]